MGGNQIGRPEPDRERKLGAVHDGAGSHRSLPVVFSTLEGEGPGGQRPAPPVATGRADEALGPAPLDAIGGTVLLPREALLKLQERTRKLAHGSPSPCHHILCRRSPWDKPSPPNALLQTMTCASLRAFERQSFNQSSVRMPWNTSAGRPHSLSERSTLPLEALVAVEAMLKVPNQIRRPYHAV